MTISEQVADKVIQNGKACVDDLLPSFPGYTREQIIRALHNASRMGFIYCTGRKSRKGLPVGSNCAATYYPMPNAMERMAATLRRNEKPRLPMVASVFELGNPKAEWPKDPAVRTIHRPLGGWHSEEEGVTA
jgi:hypothetical protein